MHEMSYKFPTGEKQHGSLVRSFVEQYKKILFHEVYLVLQFLLADIYNLEFQKFTSCRTYVWRQNIFGFSCLAQQNFVTYFFWTFQFFSLSASEFHQNISHSTASLWFCQCGISFTVADSFVLNQSVSRFEIHDMFTFQNIYYHVFSFFLFAHSQKVKQSLCPKNNVACRHRWHAKPFSVVY